MLGRGDIIMVSQDSGGLEVRFGIVRLERGRLPESFERLSGAAVGKHAAERCPRVSEVVVGPRRRLETGGGTKDLGRVRVSFIGQGKAEIEIRLEKVGLGGNGLTERGDGVIAAIETGVGKPQIKPGAIVAVIAGDNGLQEFLGGSKILLVERRLRLAQLGRS